MGKRSDFIRIEKDFYRTFDPRAVAALLPHLWPGTRFAEPCAGDGVLVDQLEAVGHHCSMKSDIHPARDDILCEDAMLLMSHDFADSDIICTNPPSPRPLLHGFISHFSLMKPTWLLFDADWKETKQSAPYIDMCVKVVAIGRLKWMEGTKMDGKDNAAWYLFDARHKGGPKFVGRQIK